MDPSVDTSAQNPFASETIEPSPSTFNGSYPSNAHHTQGLESTEQASTHSQPLAVESQSQATPSHPPPRFRASQSQYYIVFSVTGIERSNAKNPIIRFDAKVLVPC